MLDLELATIAIPKSFIQIVAPIGGKVMIQKRLRENPLENQHIHNFNATMIQLRRQPQRNAIKKHRLFLLQP